MHRRYYQISIQFDRNNTLKKWQRINIWTGLQESIQTHQKQKQCIIWIIKFVWIVNCMSLFSRNKGSTFKLDYRKVAKPIIWIIKIVWIVNCMSLFSRKGLFTAATSQQTGKIFCFIIQSGLILTTKIILVLYWKVEIHWFAILLVQLKVKIGCGSPPKCWSCTPNKYVVIHPLNVDHAHQNKLIIVDPNQKESIMMMGRYKVVPESFLNQYKQPL